MLFNKNPFKKLKSIKENKQENLKQDDLKEEFSIEEYEKLSKNIEDLYEKRSIVAANYQNDVSKIRELNITDEKKKFLLKRFTERVLGK